MGLQLRITGKDSAAAATAFEQTTGLSLKPAAAPSGDGLKSVDPATLGALFTMATSGLGAASSAATLAQFFGYQPGQTGPSLSERKALLDGANALIKAATEAAPDKDVAFKLVDENTGLTIELQTSTAPGDIVDCKLAAEKHNTQ